MNTCRIDEIYKELLEFGFILLRKAVASGDFAWANTEIELLHNIPSLIGDLNWARHDYYIDKEREAYVSWVSKSLIGDAKSGMRTYYEPLWDELKLLVLERRRD